MTHGSRKLKFVFLSALFAVLAVSCQGGLSEEDVQSAVATAIAAKPTTAQTSTPQPTATPQPGLLAESAINDWILIGSQGISEDLSTFLIGQIPIVSSVVEGVVRTAIRSQLAWIIEEARYTQTGRIQARAKFALPLVYDLPYFKKAFQVEFSYDFQIDGATVLASTLDLSSVSLKPLGGQVESSKPTQERPSPTIQLFENANDPNPDTIFAVIRIDSGKSKEVPDLGIVAIDWETREQKIVTPVRSGYGHRRAHGFDSPSPSPDGSYLIVSSQKDGNWGIYRIDLTSGAITLLTDTVEQDTSPDLSPSGDMIVFERRKGLYMINPQGGPIKELRTGGGFEDIGSPAFSPGGQFIAFKGWRKDEDNSELYMVAEDGSGLRQLTQNPSSGMTAPIWSPDGQSIIYGDFNDAAAGDLMQVFITDGSSKQFVKLESGTAGIPQTWNPSGTRLVFWNFRSGSRERRLVWTTPPSNSGITYEDFPIKGIKVLRWYGK